MLRQDLLSRHLWVLQFFEELIQTVCFSTLPPLPHLVWHQRRQTACEHLQMGEKLILQKYKPFCNRTKKKN